jgi:hypothetical protein
VQPVGALLLFTAYFVHFVHRSLTPVRAQSVTVHGHAAQAA